MLTTGEGRGGTVKREEVGEEVGRTRVAELVRLSWRRIAVGNMSHWGWFTSALRKHFTDHWFVDASGLASERGYFHHI